VAEDLLKRGADGNADSPKGSVLRIANDNDHMDVAEVVLKATAPSLAP